MIYKLHQVNIIQLNKLIDNGYKDDGLIDRQLEREKDEWMDRQMKEYQWKLENVVKYWGNDLQASSGVNAFQLDRQMDEQIERCVNRQKIRKKDRLMDGQIDERISVEVGKSFQILEL